MCGGGEGRAGMLAQMIRFYTGFGGPVGDESLDPLVVEQVVVSVTSWWCGEQGVIRDRPLLGEGREEGGSQPRVAVFPLQSLPNGHLPAAVAETIDQLPQVESSLLSC